MRRRRGYGRSKNEVPDGGGDGSDWRGREIPINPALRHLASHLNRMEMNLHWMNRRV